MLLMQNIIKKELIFHFAYLERDKIIHSNEHELIIN